ncbi:MAG: TonB-dependent receptor [Thermodesulfobacteriota bacterium]|nr:TonB-dependent receptor [Thermodesulfobacteriota bacterium]
MAWISMQELKSIAVGFFLAICLLFVDMAEVTGEPLSAEDLAFMEMEDVFAAAKHVQEIREAPASVSVVSSEDIKRYGYRNLTDVLNNVMGFYTYSDRNYDYVGVRGFGRLGDYGNRILQLVDGHTYNDNIYGSVFLGNEFGIDMDFIKRIEIVRGPGSALYGSNALFGVINVVTKTGEDVDGLFTKVEGGSFDSYQGGVLYGKRFKNGLDLIFSFSLLGSDGQDHYFEEFDNPFLSDGWARDADREKARRFGIKAEYHDFRFLANIGVREKRVPTASYETVFNDNRFKTKDERSFAEISWDHSFEDNAEMMARIYYDRYDFVGDYPWDYPPVTINRDESIGQWVGTELKYLRGIGASHSVSLGGEVIYHIDADQENRDVEPRETYFDDERNFTTWSVFMQDEWEVFSGLRLIGGLRYDHYSTFGEHFSPRVGIIGYLTRESTLKLLYGQAFRSPNVYELYYNDGNDTSKANRDLDPETLHTYELLWELELSPVVKSSFSAFHYEIKDLITQIEDPGDGLLQFQNVERVESDGVEVGLEADWPGVIKGHIRYTYQDTVDEKKNRRLSNSPRHLVKSGVAVPIFKDKLSLGVQCRFMDDRSTRSDRHADESIIADLNILAHDMIIEDLDISFGVFNLFDEDYSDPASAIHVQDTIEQNGRNYWFKASYLF